MPFHVVNDTLTLLESRQCLYNAGLESYDRQMPELLAPTVRLQTAWREAHDEWGPGAHEDGFGLLPEDDVSSSTGFTAWLERLTEMSDPATRLDDGQVHCTYRWIVEADRVLGGIALRHELNEFLLREGGHIGYGIRPSARREGLATWALEQILTEAGVLGLETVLIVCAVENIASARTVERCGGVLEDIRDTDRGSLRRYWIRLNREV
jgi:predicted acetyltransferase